MTTESGIMLERTKVLLFSKGAVEDDDQNNVVDLIFEVPKRMK